MNSYSARWANALAEWSIPAEILNQAPTSPWIHPPALFGVPNIIQSTPSHVRAYEAMPIGGTVLDVGCGGGMAAFAVTPPARHAIGVDHQPEMLTMFSANADSRGVTSETYDGFWPAVEALVPMADVVTAHNVVYNVGDIVPFLRALHSHARSRVVIELPTHHPLANMSNLWQHFWQLDRPVGPTPQDLLLVLKEMGIDAQSQTWEGALRAGENLRQEAEMMCIRLCLPLSRTEEVEAFIASQPAPGPRQLTTIWWDAH